MSIPSGFHSSIPTLIWITWLGCLAASPVVSGAPTSSVAFDEMAYCASLGPKRPNTPARALAAERIHQRLSEIGLATSRETYTLPAFIQDVAHLQVLAPRQQDIHTELLSYASNGSIEAEAVYAGEGQEQDYEHIDARDKIVIVQRSEVFHRQAQMKQIVAHGGKAMLYLSDAPDNLVQVGVIEDAIRPMPPIPAMSIGAEDGKALVAMLQKGPIRLALTAQAHLENATGENVIGVQRGTKYPDRYVLVGGHYDSWYDGAVDNCTAVGTLLQMAHAMAAQPMPYTTIFAAWDNEEVGLVGSYDWIINHQDMMARMAFMINLEEVSAAAHIGGQRYPRPPRRYVRSQVASYPQTFRVSIRKASRGCPPPPHRPTITPSPIRAIRWILWPLIAPPASWPRRCRPWRTNRPSASGAMACRWSPLPLGSKISTLRQPPATCWMSWSRTRMATPLMGPM